MIAAKYPTTCSRCAGGIDVDASIHRIGRDSYHDGCEPEAYYPDQIGPGRGGQGQPAQGPGCDPVESRPRGSGFAAANLYCFDFDLDVAAEGGAPGLRPGAAKGRSSRGPLDTFFQESLDDFTVLAEAKFRERGLKITSKGTLRSLHQAGCTSEMVGDALRFAAQCDALNVGYVFQVCETWAKNPERWQARRARERSVGPGSRWSENNIDELRELVLAERLEISEIAEAFRRSEVAIQNAITKHVPEASNDRLYPAYPAPVPPKNTKFRGITLSELRAQFASSPHDKRSLAGRAHPHPDAGRPPASHSAVMEEDAADEAIDAFEFTVDPCSIDRSEFSALLTRIVAGENG